MTLNFINQMTTIATMLHHLSNSNYYSITSLVAVAVNIHVI